MFRSIDERLMRNRRVKRRLPNGLLERFDPPTFIKMDVEALEGAKRILSKACSALDAAPRFRTPAARVPFAARIG